MALKTRPSLDPKQDRSRRPIAAVALALAATGLLALGGCGGGELAGQSADTTSVETPAPATTAAPPVRTTATTTQPRTTTRPRTTTQPTTTRPRTTPAPTTTPTTTTPPSEPAEDPGVAIEEQAELELVEKISAVEYTQRGTVTGTFDGQMTLHAKVESRGVVVRFTVDVPGGSIFGRGLATLGAINGPSSTISGTAILTGGTGKFAAIRGRGLEVDGRVWLDGSRGRVHLAGTVHY